MGNILERIGFVKEVGFFKIFKGFWRVVGDRLVLIVKFIDYENLDIKIFKNFYLYDFFLVIYDVERGIFYMFKINI